MVSSGVMQKLESIVLNNVDMFAFKPMGKTDCLQVSVLCCTIVMLGIICRNVLTSVFNRRLMQKTLCFGTKSCDSTSRLGPEVGIRLSTQKWESGIWQEKVCTTTLYLPSSIG